MLTVPRATSVQNHYDFRLFSWLGAGKGNEINGTLITQRSVVQIHPPQPTPSITKLDGLMSFLKLRRSCNRYPLVPVYSAPLLAISDSALGGGCLPPGGSRRASVSA